MKAGNLLPIGSVVILKGAKRKMMIIGYMPVNVEENNKVYDYMGVIYPEGMIRSDKNFVFNSDSIDKVFFTGYVDETTSSLLNELQAVKEYASKKE